MSHTTISPLLIQLFEAESRIVDQLLAQNQDGKRLRKPVHLQGRTQPLPQGPQTTRKSADSVKICQGSSHDIVNVQAPRPDHQDVDSSLSETFSLTASSLQAGEMDGPLVILTGTSFTVQDPVSTTIDALHSDILTRADKLKHMLTKPKWLSVNPDNRLPNNGPSLVPAARISESASSPAPTSQEDCAILSNSLTQQNLSDFQKRKNSKSEPSIQLGRCYNLRKRKSSIEERETVEESSAPKRCRTLNGSHCVLDTAVATAVSDLPASVSDDSTGGQTKGKTYQKPQGIGLNHRKGRSEPRKCSAAVLTAMHILRRRRRVVVGRSTNLLCVSCKHGVIRTECQICTLTRMDSKKSAASLKIASKAKTLKKGVPLRKQSSSVNKSSSNLISSKAGNKMPSRSGQNSVKNMKAKQSSHQVECSLKQHSKPTSRSAKSLNFQSKIKYIACAIALKHRANQAKLSQSKPKATSTKAVLSNSKTNHTNATGSKAKSNSERTIHLKAKTGCASAVQSNPKSKKACTVQSKADTTKKALNSILEHHKQLSSKSQAAEDDETFSSTKDMFSQLCQLQERSKEYDASVLDTIIPVKHAHGERVFTKPTPLYSSAQHSSHIGGIWKSIFSER